jgi:hypothetical protein
VQRDEHWESRLPSLDPILAWRGQDSHLHHPGRFHCPSPTILQEVDEDSLYAQYRRDEWVYGSKRTTGSAGKDLLQRVTLLLIGAFIHVYGH